jgi:nucleoside-diphosphate-sugar epimerase
VRGLCRPGDDRRRAADVSGEIEWVEADLIEAPRSLLEVAGRGVEAAIHAAWSVIPGEYLTSPANDSYCRASLRLLSSLIASGCGSIVGIGTCFEYEQRATPLDEKARTRPLTPYAAAKLETALAAEALTRDAGIRFAWARLFYLYGPWEDPRRLVSGVTLKLLEGKRAAVTRGRQVRDFLHVADVAGALVSVALGSVRGPVNIGSGVPVTVREVLETIGDLTGRSDLLDFGARADNLVDPPYVCADNARLRDETHWEPQYSLRAGLEQTIAWWRSRA